MCVTCALFTLYEQRKRQLMLNKQYSMSLVTSGEKMPKTKQKSSYWIKTKTSVITKIKNMSTYIAKIPIFSFSIEYIMN